MSQDKLRKEILELVSKFAEEKYKANEFKPGDQLYLLQEK